MDIDTDTPEEKALNILNWNTWKNLRDKNRKSNKRTIKEICVICKTLYAHDSMRIHVLTKTHLDNERKYIKKHVK
jgi:hypothetical protein